MEPCCDIVQGSSDGEEQFARMSDLHDVSIKMELSKNQDEISTEVKPVTSSRAKLKSKNRAKIWETIVANPKVK